MEREERITQVAYDYDARDKVEVGACNLCGSQHHSIVTHTDRYGFAVPARLCLHCGLGFLSPRLTAHEYGAFYATVYRPLVSAFHGRIIDQQTIQADQATYAEYVWELLEPDLERGRSYSLLDVGGSTGVVAARFRSLAREGKGVEIEVTVLDPAPLEVEVARRDGMDTIVGLVEEFDPGARRWDIVLLCQTVDHLIDVNRTLTKIRHLMNDSGRFFVDVVDWEFAMRRSRNVGETVKIDHPHMLTRDTMSAYLRMVGYRPIREAISPSGHLVGMVCEKAGAVSPDEEGMRQHAMRMLSLVRLVQAEQ